MITTARLHDSTHVYTRTLTEAVSGDGLVTSLARAARARDEDIEREKGGSRAGDEKDRAEEEPAFGHGVREGEGAAACLVDVCIVL